ncbi:MAG: sensor histidine kinase [Candidatus Xenobia bacterium]
MADDSLERNAALSRVLLALIRGVCHELNNPLTGILGYSQLLLASPLQDDELREDLTHIDQCARRIEDLVNLLGRYSGRERMGSGACRLEEVVGDTVQAWEYAMHRQGIELQQSGKPDDVRLVGPERDVRLLLSLLFEAVVQGLPDGGALRLDVAVAEGRAGIRVEGDAVSIPQDSRGLSVASALAELQGGRVRTLPGGAEVSLRLKDS